MTSRKKTDPSSDQNQAVDVKPTAEEQTTERPSTPTDEIPDDDPEAQLEAARLEAQQNYERLLRTSAEFENYKKRMTREMADYKKYALERVFKDLIGVVDNLERALASASDSTSGQTPDPEAIAQGVQMTLSETLRVFKSFGVQPIEAVGQPFDPAFHQAVAQEENSQFDENTVLSELQKGYLINDRLLRAAMVVVSKAVSSQNETKADNELKDASHPDKE